MRLWQQRLNTPLELVRTITPAAGSGAWD